MGEADQYPWSFGDGVARRSREALRMRYRLLPYLYSVFMEAARSGAPVMRPLVFHYQQDRQARETDDIFLLGDALLVAPITEAGQTSRHVYLPEGQWIDFATGEMFEGTQFITAAAPLDHCPVFVRGGAVVPTYADAPHSTMEHQPECIELNLLAPNRDGEFVSELWEDDGISMAHERGAYLHTTFAVKRAGKRLTLDAKVDGKGFQGFRRRSFRLLLRGATVVTLRLNGVELVEQAVGLARAHVGALRQAGIMEFDNAGEGFSLEMTLA
jgi:alpha-glucosidase